MTPGASLRGRLGQAAAVAIAGLVVVSIWFGLIDPLRSWFDDQGSVLEQRRALLHRMQEVAAGLPALRATSQHNVGRDHVASTTMLAGATDSVAAADLQERVQKMASDAGISLTAVETLAATPTGKWHKVSLRISLNAPWPVLMAFVRSIEQSPARILIDDVHFHSATVVAHPTVLPIQASMVLFGFRSAEADAGT